MAKCPAHSGRGRAPKDCAACAAGRPSGGTTFTFAGGDITVTTSAIAVQAASQRDHAAVPAVATRRKRKGYEVHYEDEPTIPRHTADGATWLDPSGNPPKVDADGKLTEPFIFQLANGAKEQWFPPLRLPMAPAVLAAFHAEEAAKAARKHKAAK